MNDNEIPILLIIFNRPDKIKRLVESLTKIKPKHVYVTGDGPRAYKPNEEIKCQEARAIATNLPWQCEIHTNFSDSNLGCKRGVSSGVTWFFNNVEKGIILEDDCLPNPAFFSFCNDMFKKYQNEDRVMHINGTSFLSKTGLSTNLPYYFSSITHSWGWATWKRSWLNFDFEMQNIEDLEKRFSKTSPFKEHKHTQYWIKLFKHTKEKARDSWAVPWAYSVMYANGVCITPTVNLIENIGFDDAATHTTKASNYNLPISDLFIPTSNEKKNITPSKDFDSAVTEKIFMVSIKRRIILLLEKWYNSLNTSKL